MTKRDQDKTTTLANAIRELVHDGDRVAMGLCLESLIPFAAGHELIRQNKKDLSLIGPISDILFDELIGAGCVKAVISAWVGNVGAGMGYNFRGAIEKGIPQPLLLQEHSNFTITLALKAAALGVTFLPTKTGAGGDIIKNQEAFRSVTCPFTSEQLTAVKAVVPDVTILHVQRADTFGNAHMWGNLGVTVEAAYAADRVILTCEEIVDREIIAADPNRTLVPGILVDAVVHEPLGAHPSPVQGFWKRDDEYFLRYHEHSRSRDGFLAWLKEWVTDLPSREAYRTKLGEQMVNDLRITEKRLPIDEVNYGST
ncbi:MAG: CoA transferase subunit A [Deltaproteobacteria bacterium]|nr:CoA transferase subunit A [Deltaproteobacteria bacterium]